MLGRRKQHTSRRVRLDDASAEAWVGGLVAAAAEIRLPELFAKPHPDSMLSVANRSGVAVTVLRTADLREEQVLALLRYRLAQYLEANFVDASVVHRQRLEHEQIENVRPNDIHVVAGTVEDGEILCYATLEASPDAPAGSTLRTRDRPLLPVEQVHGFGIFNRLPIVPDLPLDQIREIGRFVKNHRYRGVDDRSIRGPVEVGVAMFRVIAETLAFELSAVVGDLEEGVAKQNFDFFHVPLVVVHGTMPLQDDGSWLFPRYLLRDVYPFALLASDSTQSLPRLAEIEQCLGRPGKLGLLSLMRLRNARDDAPIRSSLSPAGGLGALTDAALPQVDVPMARRRELRAAGARLNATPLLAGLSEAEASVLSTFVESLRADPETVIVRQGEEADALYFVSSGEVEVRSRAADGTSTPVARIRAGDYFGEIGVLTGSARIADVVAVEPTELLRLSRADYERYLAQVSEVGGELGRTAAGRAVEAARRLLG